MTDAGENQAHGAEARARRVADIRAWRDQTEGAYGLPHYPSDPPLVTNNKGWWRDVCDLLDVMDGKPARQDPAELNAIHTRDDVASRWRKKPVVIEAMPFNGSKASAEAIIGWAGAEPAANVTSAIRYNAVGHRLEIPTYEGVMDAAAGDWIIRGVQGEFYPCKPDIFAATYEPAEGHDA